MEILCSWCVNHFIVYIWLAIVWYRIWGWNVFTIFYNHQQKLWKKYNHKAGEQMLSLLVSFRCAVTCCTIVRRCDGKRLEVLSSCNVKISCLVGRGLKRILVGINSIFYMFIYEYEWQFQKCVLSQCTEVGRAPLIHFQKIFFRKGFLYIKISQRTQILCMDHYIGL